MSQEPNAGKPSRRGGKSVDVAAGPEGILKRLYGALPQGSRARIRAFLSLPAASERRWYMRLLLRHSILRQAWRYHRPEHPVRSVLFVCYGNIMRSAFAEAALRREAEQRGWDISVASAGTNARNGKRADPRADESAMRHGLSLAAHGARLLDRSLVDEADVIVPMDYMNAARILARFPDAANRVVMLAGLGEKKGGSLEIVDPYDQSPEDANACFDRIESSVRGLAGALAPAPVR